MNLFYYLLLFFSICTGNVYAQPAGYSFGRNIEISSSLVSGSSDLLNFPAYLELNDPALRHTSNGGNIQNINGFDIIFTLSDCATPLTYQIEDYDPVTGNLIVWVRVPVLSASINTLIYMYYGNSSVSSDPSSATTWTSNYEGVWHMNNDPSSSTLTDYSGNGVNGTSFGGMTSSDLVTGKLGDAIDFDGANDYFALANKFYTNSGEIPQLTISAWINTTFTNTSMSSNWSILDFDRSEYFNMFIHGDGRLGFATRAGSINDSYAGAVGDLNDGNWHHVVGVFNGTDKLLYVDGALALTVTNPHGGVALGTGANRFGFIGDGSEANSFNGSRNNRYYDGMYDEIRFLSTSLSSDWIATEYNNQNNPSSFYTLAGEQSANDLCLLLPVEFGTLHAKLTLQRSVDITWNTVTEVNSDYFEVLRSGDGMIWEVLDVVNGAGHSSQELHYQFVDLSPRWTTSYYCIKQVDFDGNFSYSPIRSVHLTNESETLIYPNPVSSELYIEGWAVDSELRITDKLGQSVIGEVNFTRLSSNKIQLNLSNLSDGMYLVTIGGKTTKVCKHE